MSAKGVKKPRGMYKRTGELVLTPKNQAPELVFPERNGGHCFIGDFPGRIDQADDPFLQEALERGGHEAFADGAPRGPVYPLWALGIAAEIHTWDTEEGTDDHLLEGFTYGDDDGDTALLAKVESDDLRQNEGSGAGCDESPNCPHCHSGACAFAGRIKERIGHPASAFAKFPRGSIPIACGQCLNSFG